MEAIKSNKLLPVDVIGDIERLESGEALSLAQLTAHLRALKTALSAKPPADVMTAMTKWEAEMSTLLAAKSNPQQGFMYSWGCGWDGRLGQVNALNQLPRCALTALEQTNL